jgi:hypothetical protein
MGGAGDGSETGALIENIILTLRAIYTVKKTR